MKADKRAVDAAERPSWGGRLVGIEGLRGIAAFTVLVGHVKDHLSGDYHPHGITSFLLGQMGQGLTLFFVLSGFLLYRPFAAAIVGSRPAPRIGAFLRNRALRIAPAYVVILAIVSFGLGTAYKSSAADGPGIAGVPSTVGRMLSPHLLITNFTLTQTFFPSTIKTGLGVSWSLTTEVCFYLLLPLFFLGAVRLARRLRPVTAALLPVAVMLVVGTVVRYLVHRSERGASAGHLFYLQWGSSGHAVLARSILTQADLFAFGMAAAVLVVAVESGVAPAEYRRRVRAFCVLAVVVGVLAQPIARRITDPDPTVALWCAGLVAFLVLAPGRTPLLGRILESPPLHYLGLVSYSLYLWHVPVLWFLYRHGWVFSSSTPTGFLANVGVVLAVALVLSTATYHLVEAPALRRKRRTDAPSRTEPAVAVS